MISLAATKFMNEQFEVDHNGCFEEVWAGPCSHLDGKGTRCGHVVLFIVLALQRDGEEEEGEEGGGG